MQTPLLSSKRRDKNPVKFTFGGGTTWALCREVANFLKWNVWGMEKEWIRVAFRIGSLKVIDEREKIDRRGFEMIWEDSCAQWWGQGLQLQGEKKRHKINEVASLLCDTRGHRGLRFNPASCSPNKDLVSASYIINASQMAEGLPSSVLSDTYLKVCL